MSLDGLQRLVRDLRTGVVREPVPSAGARLDDFERWIALPASDARTFEEWMADGRRPVRPLIRPERAREYPPKPNAPPPPPPSRPMRPRAPLGGTGESRLRCLRCDAPATVGAYCAGCIAQMRASMYALARRRR